MNRALPPVIPAQAGIYSPLYRSVMERGPGDGPKPHHSQAKTPAMLDRQRGPATAGVLARDTWHHPCGFGPSGGELHPRGYPSCSS